MALTMLQPQSGPLYLTPEELSAYDGSDPKKPIYLAINHTIYDVTAGARMYGPGGSYHHFAGCDASRAYVTGCFAEDRTPDMRGAEEMYLPLDDSRVDRLFPAGELAAIRQEERKVAKQKVHDALKHWVDFFANSKKYHFVGYVKREEGWLKKMKRRKLCDQAAKGRKPRDPPKRD
jgi:predicted heme/steroid binding protein